MLAMLLALLGGMAAIAGLSGGGSSKATLDDAESTPDARTQDNLDQTPQIIQDIEPSLTTPQQSLVQNTPDARSQDNPDQTPQIIQDIEPSLTTPQQSLVQNTTEQPDIIEPPKQPADVSPPSVSEPEFEVLAQSGQTLTGTADSGRVTHMELPNSADIVSARVISDPDFGKVTINPDNSLSIVLTGTTDLSDLTFKLETENADGTSTIFDAELNVNAGTQDAGWGEGDLYMLETDNEGNLVIEHGDNHRDVYVSNSENALTVEDIASREGLSPDNITARFLADHPEYGGSPEMALQSDIGMKLWYRINDNKEPNSNWLHIERGYEYENMGRLVDRGVNGESELHPHVITAYGEGSDPVVQGGFLLYQEFSANVVISGIDFTHGSTALGGSNLILDNLTISGDELNLQRFDGLTLRDSEVYDVRYDAPVDGGDYWDPSPNRISGIYVGKSDGILIENTLFDYNGWEQGYDEALNGSDPQPPSFYSHNVYIQADNRDVTFRDNIITRGASFGAQIRPGGFIEDNIFIDNNAALNTLGGNYKGAGWVGNYSFFAGNVITSGAHKNVDAKEGALTGGADIRGNTSTLVGNIVTHLADPNNASELGYKETTHQAVFADNDPFYNDTIVYNWVASKYYAQRDDRNENTEGLDETVLDQTTIQNFAAQLLGQGKATIDELATYLRAETGQPVDADQIIAYFQKGFGIYVAERTDAETLRFIPDALGEGTRWDNRINWSTEDLPGAQEGDSVDLAGSAVQYGGTTTLENLNFGNGGELNVTQGLLKIQNYTAVGDDGATLNIDGAGQFWMNGYADKNLLTINVDGGRIANTGLFTGTTKLTVTDNAQVILATDGADFALNNNSSLSIVGDDARVGFDGENGGTSVLLLGDDTTLSFTAQDGLGEISEFRSGHFDIAEPDVQSGVNLGDAELHLDISELTGGDALEETLIQVDELVGTFENVTIIGLGATQDAVLSIDYSTDTVKLQLGSTGEGTGKVTTTTTGDETNAQANTDLWAALTNGHGIYPDDPPEDIQEEQNDALFEA